LAYIFSTKKCIYVFVGEITGDRVTRPFLLPSHTPERTFTSTLSCIMTDAVGKIITKTSLAKMKLMQNPNMDVETIDPKCLVSSHHPNDVDFGMTEFASLKPTHIFSLDDWIKNVKQCKQKLPSEVI
jgi:hypothetical protein